MKIAILSYYSGLVDRGVETYVQELGNRLTESGHQVRVYQSGSISKQAKYRVFSYNSRSRLPDIDCDLLISTGGRRETVLAKLWSIKNRKPFIIPGQSGPGLDDRLNLWAFPSAFVALTEAQSVWARTANPFAKVVTIPNGVDVGKFAPTVAPMKLNLPKPVVLCVSALTANKRQDLLIHAAARLGVSVLLVGRGDREKSLRGLGETLLKDRFKLLSLPYIQTPSVYIACDVFSFPTVPWEAFGIVLLEAMASNLPVVATNDPIRREIVGQAGLFIDPADIDAYAKAIWKAIQTDWEYLPRAQAEKYSWDSVSARYQRLFSQLSDRP